MNPLDLRGPQFLVFFIALLVAAGIAIRLLRNLGGSGVRQATAPEITDPYLIAYLRNGAQEVWRLATVTLLDRCLLSASGTVVTTRPEVENTAGYNVVEQATLAWFRKSQESTSIFRERSLDPVVRLYETQLTELGLLPSESLKRRRHLLCGVIIAGLVTLALNKVVVALSRGHSNILFLLLLTIFGSYVLWTIGNPRRTGRGEAILGDLSQLFYRLKTDTKSLESGKTTNEMLWTVAIFGLAVLPNTIAPHLHTLYRSTASSSSSSGGDSSGGSSCGSSCGGGGCGGGCGGCGS